MSLTFAASLESELHESPPPKTAAKSTKKNTKKRAKRVLETSPSNSYDSQTPLSNLGNTDITMVSTRRKKSQTNAPNDDDSGSESSTTTLGDTATTATRRTKKHKGVAGKKTKTAPKPTAVTVPAGVDPRMVQLLLSNLVPNSEEEGLTSRNTSPTLGIPTAASKNSKERSGNGSAIAPNLSGYCPDSASMLRQQKKDFAAAESKQAKKNGKSQMKALIKTAVKTLVWKGVKYTHGEDSQEKAAKYCMRALDLDYLKGNSEKAKENRAEWLMTYKADVVKEINGHRGYAQKQIQKACVKWMRENDGDMPTMEMILKCLNRTIDIDNPQEYKYFEWYWNQLMPKAAANRADWNESKRHYMLMHNAAPPNAPNQLYVPPSTEAYAVWAIESNHARWPAIYEKQVANPARKYHTYSTVKEGLPEETESKKKPGEYYLNGAVYIARYTIQTAGQSENPGITKEGRDRFTELKKMSKNARQAKTIKAYEQKFLDKLRQDLGLKKKSKEEERKAARRKEQLNEEKDEDDGFDDDIFGDDDDEDDDDEDDDGDDNE